MCKIIAYQKSLLPIPKAGLMLAVIFTLLLAGTKTFSQTVATGHVTAEVVESVSAATKSITSFELSTITERETKQLNQVCLTTKILDLGAVTLHSGQNMSCSVVVKSISLFNAAGNGFTLEPFVKNNLSASAANEDGSQTIQVDGLANLSRGQASGFYKGSYTVVFAYN